MLHARQPQLHEAADRPPREVTVTLEALQVFPAAPTARSLTGIGRITTAGEQDRELAGRRVYFSAIRRISIPPLRSGRYTVRGVIEALPAGTAEAAGFNDYLANLGIRQKLTRAHILREERPPGRFQRFCSRAEARLETILRHGLENHPQVLSLYLGMMLGEKAVLSTEQQNAFMRSGTFHIFSISGLHVGVIALALQSLLRLLRVPRRPAVVASLALLWLYVQITGASSPAERAFLMIAFLLASQVFRLPGNGLAALTAAALVTLLLDPLQLFSTGFQMSYTVVVALIIMAVPLGEKWLAAWQPFGLLPKVSWRRHHHAIDAGGRWLVGSAAACWVAFLASTPAGIGYFQVFSPGSLVANLLIIPVSSLALVAGFLSLLTGLVGLLSLSALFNSAAAVTLIAMDWLVRRGTELPGVYFPAHFTHAWMAPAAVGLLLAVMFASLSGRWKGRYGGFWPPVLTLVLIVVFGVKFD
jgi:competence protein ComEC